MHSGSGDFFAEGIDAAVGAVYNRGMEHGVESKALDGLVAMLKQKDPEKLGLVCGGRYVPGKEGAGLLEIDFFDRTFTVTVPGFIICEGPSKEAAPHMRALFLYHLATADGAVEEKRWVALSELPGGAFYNAAYQGYSGNRIVKVFENDMESLKKAARRSGGTPESIGDLGFRFQALPRVPLCLAYWCGDDEFPPSARVLFDGSASHYLPTDLCAFLGSTLTEMVIKAAGR